MLESKNIQLRALEKEDLDLLYKWENDTGIWKLSQTLIPFSKYTLQRFIEDSGKDLYESRQFRFIISHIPSGRALGTIDIFDFDPENLRCGVGILIAEPEDRKKGYASEALDNLLDYGTNILKLKQVWCNILESNEDSLKLFISKGFTITGSKRFWVKTGSGWETEFFLQRLLSE